MQDELQVTGPLQPTYSEFIQNYVSTSVSSLIIRANSLTLPETATNGRKASPTSSKDYYKDLSKLFNSTVERAKNEFTTRASTLRRSKRNRLADRQKRASWNEPSSGYEHLQAEQPQAEQVGGDKMDGRRSTEEAWSDRSSSTKSSQLTNASSSSTASRTGAVAKKKAVPPTTILSLEDRDLVIIDKNDINESVQNESEVIVVDHPPKEGTGSTGDVDLMDILAQDWPALAGDMAHGLNAGSRRASGGPVMKPNLGELPTRNKSMNIISHLKNTKGSAAQTLPRSGGGGQHHQGSGGSTNSSFESSHSGSTAGERRKSEFFVFHS